MPSDASVIIDNRAVFSVLKQNISLYVSSFLIPLKHYESLSVAPIAILELTYIARTFIFYCFSPVSPCFVLADCAPPEFYR